MTPNSTVDSNPANAGTPPVNIGPLQIAAFLIGGGGLAVALSAALPWVTALGGASGRPGGGAVLALLILGGSLTFLASLVFRVRSLSTARVLLWVLAVVDIVVVLAFFGLMKADSGIVGDVVSPSTGFYLALIGLLSSIAGTITQQIAKPKDVIVATGQPVAMTIHPTANPTLIPAQQPQSPDGHYWWNGTAWVAYE